MPVQPHLVFTLYRTLCSTSKHYGCTVNLNVRSLTWRKYRAYFWVRRSWPCTRLHWCLVTLQKPNWILAKYRHNSYQDQCPTAALIEPKPLCCPHLVKQWRFNQTNKQRTHVKSIASLQYAVSDLSNWESFTHATVAHGSIWLCVVRQCCLVAPPSELRHHCTLSWLFLRLLVWPSSLLLYEALLLLHFSKKW